MVKIHFRRFMGLYDVFLARFYFPGLLFFERLNGGGHPIRNRIHFRVSLSWGSQESQFILPITLRRHVPVKSIEDLFAKFAFISRFNWTSQQCTHSTERVEIFVCWCGDMGESKIKGSGKTVRCFVVQYVERVYRSASLKWISSNIVLGKGSMKYELRFDVG